MRLKTETKLDGVEKEEVLRAIREGVYSAMWDLFTNATTMPCADFYDQIRLGVREAMLQMYVKPEENVQKALDPNP